jgi:hypothetical protein
VEERLKAGREVGGFQGRGELVGGVERVTDRVDHPTGEEIGFPIDLGEGELSGEEEGEEIVGEGEGVEVGFGDGAEGGGEAVVEEAAAPAALVVGVEADHFSAGDVEADGAGVETAGGEVVAEAVPAAVEGDVGGGVGGEQIGGIFVEDLDFGFGFEEIGEVADGLVVPAVAAYGGDIGLGEDGAGVEDDFAFEAIALGFEAGEDEVADLAGLGGVEAHGHEGGGNVGGRILAVVEEVELPFGAGVVIPPEEGKLAVEGGGGVGGLEVVDVELHDAEELDAAEAVGDELAHADAGLGVVAEVLDLSDFGGHFLHLAGEAFELLGFLAGRTGDVGEEAEDGGGAAESAHGFDEGFDLVSAGFGVGGLGGALGHGAEEGFCAGGEMIGIIAGLGFEGGIGLLEVFLEGGEFGGDVGGEAVAAGFEGGELFALEVGEGVGADAQGDAEEGDDAGDFGVELAVGEELADGGDDLLFVVVEGDFLVDGEREGEDAVVGETAGVDVELGEREGFGGVFVDEEEDLVGLEGEGGREKRN